MNKRRVKNDIKLILALTLLPVIALSFFLIFQDSSNENSQVLITVKGQIYDRIPLNENTSIEIKTDLGINQVEIQDGQVWVSSADCRDQLCVNHKAVSLTGGQIICLPNQVVISVESSDKAIDSLSE